MNCLAPPASNGHGGCSRVSCKDYSAIWLCNDEDVEIRLPCSEVASAALELSNVCYWVVSHEHYIGLERKQNTGLLTCACSKTEATQ